MAERFSPSARIMTSLRSRSTRICFSHGLLNFFWRINIFDFNTVELIGPGIGGFIQDESDFGVDQLSAGQGLVQLEFADDISECCCCQARWRPWDFLHRMRTVSDL